MAKKPLIVPRAPGQRGIDPVAAQRFIEGAGVTDDRPSLVAVPYTAEDEKNAAAAVDSLVSLPNVIGTRHGAASEPPTLARQPSEQLMEHRGRRKNLTRIDGRAVRQTTVYLEPHVFKRLRIHCAEHDINQSDIVNQLLKEYLAL
jgi:hypothetical protein